MRNLINILYLASIFLAVSCGIQINEVADTKLAPTELPDSLLLSPPPDISSLQVNSFYTNGINWLDFIKNDGSDIFNAADISCDGSENGSRQVCIHGGELRKLEITNLNDCTGLAITDSEAVFDWACDDTNSPAYIYTTGLKDGKGLADLIKADGSDFKEMNVTISNSDGNSTSITSKWWSNPITSLPDNSSNTDSIVNLSSSGTIYVLVSSRPSQGYRILANKVAIVTLNSATMTYAGRAGVAQCRPNIASVRSAICVHDYDFHWYEGSFDGDGGADDFENFFYTEDANFQTFRNLTLINFTNESIELTSNYNYYKNLNISSCGLYAFYGWTDYSIFNNLSISCPWRFRGSIYNLIDGAYFNGALGSNGFYLSDSSNNNTIRNFKVRNTNGHGIQVDTGNNTFINIVTSNNSSTGFYNNGSNNRVWQLASFNNGGDGINFRGGSGLRLVQALSFNNNESGLDSFSTRQYLRAVAINLSNNGSDGVNAMNFSEGTIHNSVMYNNQGVGLGLRGTDNITISQVIGQNNNSGSIWGHADGSRSYFTNNILFPNCANISGNHGISNTCVNNQRSDANISTSFSLANTFVLSPTNDTTNTTSDTNGVATYGSITDWYSFDNVNRGWGQNSGASWPNVAFRGRCTSGETCQIYDWRILATDTTILNLSENLLTINDAFINGAACPTLLDGDEVTEDISSGEDAGIDGDDDGICETGETCSGRTFLTHAFEIIGDDIGNDDGLCESSESCIYMPNLGSYQGHGDYTQNTCVFNDNGGAVTNVTMYAYPNNGVN